MTDKKEQQMKEEIAGYMRKKDYYDILGITKTATDSEIKKSYRLLALRFHPDKNQVEGAKQVFKKVSNAYSHLIDAEKRQRYDQVGPEEDRPQPQFRRNGAGAEDFEYQQFEDIFQAFFGGMPMGHHHRRRHQFRAYQQNYNQQGGQQVGGFNFYYVFVLFFLIYTILPLFQSSPNYSTTASYQYRIRRTTSKFNVEFYVNEKYIQQARNPDYKRRSQMEIDREYISQLEQKCEYAKNQKRNLQTYAYQHKQGPQRDSYLTRARNVDLTTCRYLQQLSNNHEDYVRQLTYMRY